MLMTNQRNRTFENPSYNYVSPCIYFEKFFYFEITEMLTFQRSESLTFFLCQFTILKTSDF